MAWARSSKCLSGAVTLQVVKRGLRPTLHGANGYLGHANLRASPSTKNHKNMANTISCPACGAPHDVTNPGIVMSVCEYCGNAVVLDEGSAQDLGRQAILSEGFTRLYRGAVGTVFHKRFIAHGRARYSFGHGFWDEWFLEFDDGETAWMTEDNHELALQKAVENAMPDFASLVVGTRVDVADRTFHILEKGEASCIGVEGDLPRVVGVEQAFEYVDGSSADGLYALGVEYGDSTTRVFTGRWLHHDALQLDAETQL